MMSAKRKLSEQRSTDSTMTSQTTSKASVKEGRVNCFDKITFLGTSSAVPLPLKRNVSSLVISMDRGDQIMVDCGEATQHQLKLSQLKGSKLRAVFLTHLHGDHCYGLPSLIHSLKSSERTDDLHLFGPIGLQQYVHSVLHCTGGWKGFRLCIHELEIGNAHRKRPKFEQKFQGEVYPRMRTAPDWMKSTSNEQGTETEYQNECVHNPQIRGDIRYHPSDVLDLGECIPNLTGISVIACPLTHRVDTFGYVFKEREKEGRLDGAKAAALGARGKQMAALKRGEDVTIEYKCKESGELKTRVIQSAEVCGERRPGLKVAVLQDCSYVDSAMQVCQNVDVLIHECTYDGSLFEKAVHFGHSTSLMAAEHAHRMSASLLILTHFSARFTESNTSQYVDLSAESQKMQSDGYNGDEQDEDEDDESLLAALRTEAEGWLKDNGNLGKTRVVCACDFMVLQCSKKGSSFEVCSEIGVKPKKRGHFAHLQKHITQSRSS